MTHRTPEEIARELLGHYDRPSESQIAEAIREGMAGGATPAASDLLDALRNAILQLEYVDQKFATATTGTIITRSKAVIAGLPHGCHCDLEPGEPPTGCVIDEGHRGLCIYAKRITNKLQCEYWRPVIEAVPAP